MFIARILGSIVAGMALALILAIGVEIFSAIVHPTPPGFTGTMQETCDHVARYPTWVLIVVVPAWPITALLSTWLTGRIGNRGSALFVGALLVAGVVCNVAMLPYPMWFKAAMLLLVPVGVVVGVVWSKRRRVSTAIETPVGSSG